MNAHQEAHTHVLSALDALCGLEAQVNDPATRLALRAGLAGEHGLPALMRCAADLHGAVEAAAPLLSEAVPNWREARLRLGSLERLLDCVSHSAHELVVIVACDVIKQLKQVSTPAEAFRVLDERRLNRADLEAIWVRVEEEQEATARQDGGKVKSTSGNGAGKGKGKNVNGRMLETMMNMPESHGWTAKQWAIHLKCSRGTIGETPAWKTLQSYRETKRAEGKDRRRRAKASDTDRD